jgi:hypothetical protein
MALPRGFIAGAFAFFASVIGANSIHLQNKCGGLLPAEACHRRTISRQKRRQHARNLMTVSWYLPLARVIVLGTAFAMASTAALAQKREFSFAYDQPKSSGYGAGAEMFNNKLIELIPVM